VALFGREFSVWVDAGGELCISKISGESVAFSLEVISGEQAFFSCPLFDGSEGGHFTGFPSFVNVLGIGSDRIFHEDIDLFFIGVILGSDASSQASPGDDTIAIHELNGILFDAIGEVGKDDVYILLERRHDILFGEDCAYIIRGLMLASERSGI